MSWFPDGLNEETLLAQAKAALDRAQIAPDTYEGLSPNRRNTCIFMTFREPGALRLASNKMRRASIGGAPGRNIWLDARCTREENRPARTIHRAAEGIQDLNASLEREGKAVPFSSADLTKDLRRLTITDGANWPTLCFYNPRLHELTFNAITKDAYARLGRSEDLEQMAAWCALE